MTETDEVVKELQGFCEAVRVAVKENRDPPRRFTQWATRLRSSPRPKELKLPAAKAAFLELDPEDRAHFAEWLRELSYKME